MRANKGELSCRAEATCESSSVLQSVCLSDLLPDVYAQSPPHIALCMCVCDSFLSPTSSPASPAPSLFVAAVLVMAVCPWCKLAVGSQVAQMTVIDVQVFNSSHTETLEPHTHTHTPMQTHTYTHTIHMHALQCSSQAYKVCIHIVVSSHNYA